MWPQADGIASMSSRAHFSLLPTTPSALSIPVPIARSPLMRRGGYAVVADLLDDAGRRMMLSEAMELAAAAKASHVPFPDGEEFRGGQPARRFLSASGGVVQDAFYLAPEMIRFLSRQAGVPLLPTGGRGTYTYYVRTGDHLGIHRDIVSCDVAVITCLSDTSGAGDAGKLTLYPGRVSEPLSAIRANPDLGAVKLRLALGQTLVMFGGVVPHSVRPIAPGQMRIVSVLCYRAHCVSTAGNLRPCEVRVRCQS